jgi:hypothetical protein
MTRLFTALIVMLVGSTAIAVNVLVPAYFYPEGAGIGYWNALTAATAKVPLVAILNPDSGPGPSLDPNYTNVLASFRAAGGHAIGYVPTGYGSRSLAVVKSEVDQYRIFYPGLEGIFLDEMANDSTASNLTYYGNLYGYIRSNQPNALIVGNPGTHTLEAYLTQPAADVLVTFENDTDYPGYIPDSWTTNHGATNFCHLAYAVTNAVTMTNFVQLAVTRNVGWVFIQSDALPNPWDTLPAYWTNEVNFIQQLNRARLRLSTTNGASLRLDINGGPGRYVVESSTNLAAWSAVATNITGSGQLTVPLGTATNSPGRFYRTSQTVQ